MTMTTNKIACDTRITLAAIVFLVAFPDHTRPVGLSVLADGMPGGTVSHWGGCLLEVIRVPARLRILLLVPAVLLENPISHVVGLLRSAAPLLW